MTFHYATENPNSDIRFVGMFFFYTLHCQPVTGEYLKIFLINNDQLSIFMFTFTYIWFLLEFSSYQVISSFSGMAVFKESRITFNMLSIFSSDIGLSSNISCEKKDEVCLEPLDRFPGLETLIANLESPSLLVGSLQDISNIFAGKSLPDPTMLLKHSNLFPKTIEIMKARDEQTLTFCLIILVVFTHADFSNECPFLDGDLLSWIIECLQHPQAVTRSYACRILCNLFADSVVGPEVMRRCYDMQIISIAYELCHSKYDRAVALELCSYFLELTASVCPEELRIFIPFIEDMIGLLKERTCHQEVTIDCLSVLCFNEECLDYALKLPQFSFSRVIRDCVFEASLASISNLFNIVNCILEFDSDCIVFSDADFIRHVSVLFHRVEETDFGPLLVFVDSMIDKNWETVMVSGVTEVVIELCKVGNNKSRLKMGFLLAHMLNRSLDMARYPEWINSAFLFILEVMEGMSERKAIVTLDVIISCLDRNPEHFLPLLRSSGADAALSQMTEDSESNDVCDRVSLILSLLSRGDA